MRDLGRSGLAASHGLLAAADLDVAPNGLSLVTRDHLKRSSALPAVDDCSSTPHRLESSSHSMPPGGK